jgi:hypothetical protein
MYVPDFRLFPTFDNKFIVQIEETFLHDVLGHAAVILSADVLADPVLADLGEEEHIAAPAPAVAVPALDLEIHHVDLVVDVPHPLVATGEM